MRPQCEIKPGNTPYAPWAKIKGTHYYWDQKTGDNITGNILGVEIELSPSTSFELGSESSNTMNRTAFGRLTVKLPFDGNEKLNTFQLDDAPFRADADMSGELLAMVERSNTIKQDGVIRFNGLTYRLVTSPDTGRVWLDRNLGATQACTSSANSACYGNLYQWGRDDDGHEFRTSSTDGTRLAGISTVSTNYITGNNDWTTVSSGASALRIAAWANGGSNDTCPAGFSVPTETELAADTTGASITNSASAFSSFLKLPVSGIRFADASINREGSTGYLWARSNGNGSHLRYKSGNASINGAYRAHGIGVRCIKG